ncbi:uncharacterized protein LOC123309684 [Coccinella septempunctata]|uniref:uncharacterized protein LOC123309684 n=1 Tax=Coccinella septempunctata TaxID=41139 RepID=UPI001D071108|nr:uncharacterized protein LOC123309684 [Coccinella septempunctata]
MSKPIAVLLICAFTVSVVLAKPAGNELDNVSADDTSLNAVDNLKNPESNSVSPDANQNSASVQITGISTGILDSPPSNSDTNFKPQRAGTMFARFIDDIFNIPITVLQSVAKLITNPFNTKSQTPENH